MADIPELDVEVDQKNYEEGLRKVLEVVRPTWKSDDIKFKYLTQGYVNHMISCFVDEDNKDDWIVARIFGTDLKIEFERDVEINNSKLFGELNIGAPVYGIFKNGLLFKFVKGKTFFWTDLSPFRDIKLCKAVARELAKVHSKHTLKLAVEKYHIDKAKSFVDKMKDWMTIPWPEVIFDEETTKWYNSETPSMEERVKEIDMLLDLYNEPSVLDTHCHGDSNPTNMIYDEENDKITLCDFEGAGISPPLIDLCSFLSGAASGLAPDPEGMDFSPEFKREFLREYLSEKDKYDGGSGEVDEDILAKYEALLEIMNISFNYFYHILGVMLALSPDKHGSGNKFFLNVGVSRLKYYYKHRERMLAIKVPGRQN